MASLQDIRRHIRSVTSIKQITNAMDMVANSRLRHAKEAANNNRPYAEKVNEVVRDIAAHSEGFSHPLLEEHEGGKRLFLVMAADKGLAGAYSSNACKKAVAEMGEDGRTAELITVGRKTRDYFRYRNYNIVNSYIGISERPSVENARTIAQELIKRYESGEYSSVTMIYTRFVNTISCVPEAVPMLPFNNLAGDGTEESGPHAEYIYEPNAEEVLGFLLPQYLFTTIYAALLQSAASELSSRMNAMSNATDNAEELVGKLNLHYNKVRQAGITTELNEIVSGAEALK